MLKKYINNQLFQPKYNQILVIRTDPLRYVVKVFKTDSN